jgi:hypothetical protein
LTDENSSAHGQQSFVFVGEPFLRTIEIIPQTAFFAIPKARVVSTRGNFHQLVKNESLRTSGILIHMREKNSSISHKNISSGKNCGPQADTYDPHAISALGNQPTEFRIPLR